MTPNYCNKKIEAYSKEINTLYSDFSSLLPLIKDIEKITQTNYLSKAIKEKDYEFIYNIFYSNVTALNRQHYNSAKHPELKNLFTLYSENNLKKAEKLKKLDYRVKCFETFLQDKERNYNGSIVITDPCYLIPELDYNDPNYSEKYDKIRDDIYDCIAKHNYLLNSTIYGDWSCTTYDSKTKKPIGQFGADGGEVCVVPLDMAIKFNPDLKDYIFDNPSFTVIPDFKGKVQIKIDVISLKDWEFNVSVKGYGNKPFFTSQTGL